MQDGEKQMLCESTTKNKHRQEKTSVEGAYQGASITNPIMKNECNKTLVLNDRTFANSSNKGLKPPCFLHGWLFDTIIVSNNSH
jgi:hypothetical protein